MSRNNPPISVAEALEMVPSEDSWLNDGFTGVVRSLKSPPDNAQKKYWKTVIGDTVQPNALINMTVFFYPKFKEGDLIEVVGKGIKRKEYNGSAEIGVGKTTEFHVIGTHVAATRPAAAPAGGDARSEAQHENASPASSSFHDKMKSHALLYLHALSYARKINKTLTETGHEPLEGAHFQACVSSLFIAGDRVGCSLNPPPIGAKPAAPAAAPAEPTPAPQGGRADAPKGANKKPPAGPDGTVALPKDDEDVPF